MIENWTHHAPERNEGVFEQPEAGAAEIIVEYFQLDGHAILELDVQRLAPVAAPAPAPPSTSVP